MMADGRGWLYSPSGLLDGPLPAHYEPVESPVANLLYPGVPSNPTALSWNRPDNPANPIGDPRYPLVATTFRLTEHHTAGAMSRNLPWLAELQPEMFAEIDPLIARERGIEDGGWMTIVTERAEIEARAKVTERMRPLNVGGRLVHQVALPWHWGFYGELAGRHDQRPRDADQRPERLDPGVEGVLVRHPRRPSPRRDDGAPQGSAHRAGRRATAGRPPRREPEHGMSAAPGELAVRRPDAERLGFFTDTTVCIGCKACEVACKQWNDLPSDGGELRPRRIVRPHRRAVRLDLAPRPLRRGVRAVGVHARRGGRAAGRGWRRERAPDTRDERRGRAHACGARGRRLGRALGGGPGPCRLGRGEQRGRRSPKAARWTSPRRWPTWTAGCSCRTSASTARTPGASTRARRARSSAPSSRRW